MTVKRRTISWGLATIALTLGLGTMACGELIEEPKSFTTTDTFYQTAADLNVATFAVYQAFRGWQGQGIWTTLELASDQTRAENREPNAGTRGPDYLDWSASTGNGGAWWNTGYTIITRANLVLDNAPNITATDTAQKSYNIGEAKLMRGYTYALLARAYDDVPLLLSLEEQSNPRVTRTPVEQVEQAAITDMEEAEALLPAVWRTTDGFGLPTAGRLTKGAAQMALADLYLWRSSFRETGEWAQASQWAKKVIDSGSWTLNDDYHSTFLPSRKNNKEMIWFIANAGLSANTRSLFQLFYYPRDWGIDLGQGGGWGLIHPTDWHLNSYEAGDYRATMCTARDNNQCGFIRSGCAANGVCIANFADGPMPYKYHSSNGGIDWTLMDVDVPLYRFAEAYLIHAEAENELGNTATALASLNVIRARARKGTGAETRASPADVTVAGGLPLRDAIYVERNWELAFEAKRWWDLVRRNSLEPGYWRSQLLAHDQANVEKLTLLSDHKMRMPIPAGAISLNPALTQNPGY